MNFKFLSISTEKFISNVCTKKKIPSKKLLSRNQKVQNRDQRTKSRPLND